MKLIKREQKDNYVRYGYYDSYTFNYHREDGPAIIHTNGTQSWWINSELVSDHVAKWLKDHNITNWETMTEEDKLALSFYMRSLH